MIDVTWAYCRFPEREEPQEQIWNRYSSLLCELLDFSPCCRSPAGTWILHNPQLERWCSGVEAQQTVGRIARGLEQCELLSTRAWMDQQEKLLAAQMNLFGCRLYLSPERARAKLAPEADRCARALPAHVCIDFRFQEDHHRYWLCATLSIWTHKPSSETLAPRLAGEETGGGPWKLCDLYKCYARVLRAKFKDGVREHFALAEIEILGREHWSPQFWLVEDPGLPATLKTTDDLDVGGLNAFGEVLLGTPDIRSTGVAASVMERQILTLRRFVPVSVLGDPGDLPCYIVVPLGQEAVAQEEEKAWLLAQKLTDLEASTAAQLFDIATELDTYASHLRVYKAVAAQADAFWDQLALYLPRWRRLVRVHKLVELVHQTLLQGIADLDQAAIIANDALRRAGQSTSDVKDQFDRSLTERPLKGAQSIRSSLTETGYLDDATREADRVVKDAAQVQRSYATLLDGITRAFDERRVRGTDVLEHVGFALAVLVVGLSFLPEAMSALFGSEGFPSAWLVSLNIGGAGFLLLALCWVFLRRWQLGILGSGHFRERHTQLRKFLAACSTERLIRLRDVGWRRVRVALDDPSNDEDQLWNEIFTEWDQFDRKLAGLCVELLDSLDRDEDSPPAWEVKTDLDKLAWRVERWALKALLVSERPRQFWKFPLPRLTFLYRFYPMVGSELWSNAFAAPEPDVVSDSDLEFTLANHCSCRPDEVNLIKDWAQDQIKRSRSLWYLPIDFVKALDKVGLEAGMTRKEAEAMLGKMREDTGSLRSDRDPTLPEPARAASGSPAPETTWP